MKREYDEEVTPGSQFSGPQFHFQFCSCPKSKENISIVMRNKPSTDHVKMKDGKCHLIESR